MSALELLASHFYGFNLTCPTACSMCLLMVELPRNMLFNVVFQKVSSLLGPILYLLYASPLSEIVKKLNLSYHFYADDTQLYLSFQPTISGDRDLAVSNIERCVLEIDHLMLVNRLKLNRKDKTELLVISAKYLQVPINNYWMRLTMIS